MLKKLWGVAKFLNLSALVIVALLVALNLTSLRIALADEPESSPEPTPASTTQPTETPNPSTQPEPSASPEATETPSPEPSTNPTPEVSSEPSAAPEASSTPIESGSTPEPSSTPSPSTQPSSTPEPSATPSPSSTPAPSSVTTSPVSLNTPYNFSNMKVVFTGLPQTPGSITFTTKSLSSSLVNQLKALTNTVYEITSSMSNGSFTYDLTLPLPAGVSGTDFKVFYAEDLDGLNDPNQVSQQITNNGDGTFTIHNLNHFTVFVVVNPNSQANCDGVTVGTTPGSTCFTTVQAAVNASSNGDTINIGNTGSPYNETVYVNKQITISGVGNPTVNRFILQTTPVTITGITTNQTTIIETPTNIALTNPVNSGNQSNVTVSGNGAPNAVVNYSISGTSGSPVTGTGVVSAGGAINITGINLSSLPDGALTLTVYLTSGSFSSANVNANAFKDTTAPAQASNLTITNPIKISNQASISISGNAEAGTTVNWTISNGASSVSGSITATGAGTFSVTGINASSIPDGTLTLSVTTTDSAGNTSTSSTTTATKDTVTPTLTAVAIASNNANSAYAKVGNVVTLTFTSSESINTPTVTIAGNTVTASNTGGNNWTASYTMLVSDTEGVIPFTINFSDTATNPGTQVTATTNSSSVTFDRTTPTLTATTITSSNANGSYAKTGDTITLNFTSSEGIQTPTVTIAGNTVTASNTGGNNWTASYIMAGTDTEGLIAYTIAFQDIASNAGTTVNTNSTITFDRTNPTLLSHSLTSSNANANFAKVGDTVTLNFTSSENIQTPTVTIAGNTVTASNIGGNNWRATYVMAGTDTQGLIPYTIAFQDLASNNGTTINTNSSVTFDRTNPTIASSITTSNANSNYAKVGDTITVTLIGDETLQTPVVTIAGNNITPVNTTGNTWVATYVMTSSDTQGLIAYTIAYQDIASNAGTGVNTNSPITFDRTAPTLTATTVTTSNANPNYAKTGDTITVNFTSSESIQTPTVTIATNTVTASNTGGNNWTASYVMAGTDTQGLIAYTISYQDLASNSGTAVNTNSTITFDRTNPAAPVVSLTNPVNLSNQNNVSITGTGEANATFAWSITDGTNTVSGSGTVTAGGVISVTGINVTSLNDGTITLSVTLTDAAGNNSTAGTNTATKDSVTPTLTSTTITSSNANANYAKVGDTITLDFTSSESIQTPVVTIAGNTVTASNIGGNNWRATYVMAGTDTEGLIAYTIAFSDTAGNPGTTVNTNSTIVFDRTNPTLSAITVSSSNANPNLAKAGDTITITFTGSETLQTPTVTIAGQSATVVNAGGNNWSATYVMAGTDTEGLIAYTITFSDLASNVGTPINTNSTITFDRTGATAAFTAPSANSTVSGNVTLTANASDTNGVASVTFSYKRNDGIDTFNTITTINSAPYTTNWDTNALALDTYTLRITITDNAGNTNIVDQNVDVSTVIGSGSVTAGTTTGTSTIITWVTDDPTSSRVIFDTVSHPTLGTAPNYGYANSTVVQDTSPKVISHSVALVGLSQGKTYYYRVVSAGSPEAVSTEFSFTTPAASPSQSGSGPSTPGAPGCDDVKPGSAPVLLSVKVKGGKLVLTWSKAKDPVSYYSIKYGLGHDSYQFGVPTTGNVTEYEIGGLQPGVTYYFRVRAGNGCNAAGEFSNELSAKAGYSISDTVVEQVSRALGAKDVSAAESDTDLSENEASESAESSASTQVQATIAPSASAKPQITQANTLKNILTTAGVILLVAGGALYYTTLKRKV